MKYKKVTILGYGKSGIAAAKLADALNIQVFISESRKDLTNLIGSQFKYEVGVHSDKIYDSDAIIVSPGISNKKKIKQNAINRGVDFISEIEFASLFTHSKIIGITGSNGKTTVSELLYKILNESGISVMLGGNTGVPLSNNVFNEIKLNKSNEYHIVELSSFQLEDIDVFNPEISCILNISPDHLDRYDNNFENYAKTKFNILKNYTKEKCKFIYNADDRVILSLINKYPNNDFISFSLKDKSNGNFINRGTFYYDNKACIKVKDLKIKGLHNQLNILAALSICDQINIDMDTINESIINFNPVEHRIEHFKKFENINFYNDSKATNIRSTIAAVNSFSENIILLLGGIDKSCTDFFTYLEKYLSRIRIILCYGQSGKYIYNQIKPHYNSIYLDDSFNDMLKKLISLIKPYDNVLLSPGCTSFDQFDSFESRGAHFKNYINEKLK